MEILALSLLRTLATTCLRFYLGYLFASGGIQADKKDLGYAIPSWYMNPGRQASAFYAYGTSVKGDEFESLEDAHKQAVDQMIMLIQRSHQQIINEEIRYDKSSIKQQRLVELFLRGDSLKEFVLNSATTDKKQFVKVKKPEPDLRAFVRLKLDPKDYLAHQESTLKELRTRLTHQKSEDIMEELDAEMKIIDKERNPVSEVPPEPVLLPSSEPTPMFDSLQSELDNL